jgi:hypothetical protein
VVNLAAGGESPEFLARIRDARGRRALEEAGWLTPYDAELLAQEVQSIGGRASLEIILAAGTSDLGLAAVEQRFARLARQGNPVEVRRRGRHEGRPSAKARRDGASRG